MNIYDIQNSIPINSKIRVYFTSEFISSDKFDIIDNNEGFIDGILTLISIDSISVKGDKGGRLKLNQNDIENCIILEYPKFYIMQNVSKEDMKKMKMHLEEFDDYSVGDFNIAGQIKDELKHMKELLIKLNDNKYVENVIEFIDLIMKGENIKISEVYNFNSEKDILPKEWINRLLVLQYLHCNNDIYSTDAVDLMKNNIVNYEKAIDWFFLAVIYRRMDIKPKAIVLYSLKRFINTSQRSIISDNLKIIISLCILYGDYNTIAKIIELDNGEPIELMLLAKGVVCMLLNDAYDRKYEAKNLFYEIECGRIDKLKDDIQLSINRIIDYRDDDILNRIDYMYDYIVSYLKNNQNNIITNSQKSSEKIGYLFEYRTNSDSGYIIGLDFIPYFFHKNSLRNTKIISEFVDNYEKHTLDEFGVLFRKLRNMKKLQAGEIEAILLG